MPNYLAPGVYIEEIAGAANPIQPVGTSTVLFVGQTPGINQHVNRPVPIENREQFAREFMPEGSGPSHVANAVNGFFLNGGRRCYVVNTGPEGLLRGAAGRKAGVDVTEHIEEIASVAFPGSTGPLAWEVGISHCENLKTRFFIADGPEAVDNLEALTRVAVEEAPSGRKRSSEKAEAKAEGEGATGAPSGGGGGTTTTEPPGMGMRGSPKGYAALYFPWVTAPDFVTGELVNMPPSGHIAGIYARVDAERGVFKAPANELMRGVVNVAQPISRSEQELLNPAGVNCIRLLQPEGVMVWGARTNSKLEMRYVPVRRLVIFIERSIEKSTLWTVFEPNDQRLWKRIEQDVRDFLMVLWRQGALFGATPAEAFSVQCDAETNPPESIELGQVTIQIAIAPVKPAEFVVFRIGLKRGGAEKPEGATAHA